MDLAAIKERIAAIEKRAGYSRELIALLRKAAALDDVDALVTLGMLLGEGVADRRGRTILARNAKASQRHYRRAAELGSASAMDALATALSPMNATPRSIEEAIGWYRKAIRLGASCYNLAVTYQNRGEHAKAVAWFRKDAAAGSISALLPLAQAELYGVGTHRDVRAALAKLRRVAAGDETVSPLDRETAMLTLARVLDEGWLLPRDHRGALSWLHRAAKAGSAAAEGLLRDYGEPLHRELHRRRK